MFFKLFLRTCAQKRKHIRCYTRKQYFHTEHEESMLNVALSRVKLNFKQQCSSVIDGYTCIIADCPICNKTKKESKVYVNKRTGYFMCDNCKSTGSWELLEKFLSPEKSVEKTKELEMLSSRLQSKEDFTSTWENVIKDCQSIRDLSKEEYRILLNSFSLPHVPQEDMSELNCFYERASNALYFPLVGLNNNIVGYKLFSDNMQNEKTVPAAGASGCIKYKQHCNKSDTTALIVGMVDDLLTLISKTPANTILCLPYNLKSLPQQLLPYLESFKKFVLWFGNDDISWHAARSFARKLNEKRCCFIRPTDTQPRPTLAAKLDCDFKSILQNAQPLWHKSIITFQEIRDDVLSDLQNNDKVQGIKWKRYPTLNRILKGHRRGEFTVLTGPTGCGKTTFMSEYSLDLAMQGVNTLWGSFEIRNVRLARTMLQQMVGVPLDENIDKFDSYANVFEKLPLYFMTFHGQQSIKVVMDAVEHATYIHDIAHVVIDNVQFMMGTTDSSKHMDRFWKQDDIISKFRNFATTYNCHVTVIIHPRKERIEEELTTSSIFGSAKASQEADNVLIIQDKRLSSVKGKKYLQVAKNRFSGDLGIMVLDFDKSSLSYSPRLKAKDKASEKEKKKDVHEAVQ
ncbi:twinkle protein, mitochondrial [Ceratina calcarata]|uniref:DNA 5'-3' helicase n=1 Tax=Ceratina calcarata TaxID=156304 RepID=A0AAJ7S4R2_9HYME|nr:twinkle protein, mitochondrial [Ceratina calcarata]